MRRALLALLLILAACPSAHAGPVHTLAGLGWQTLDAPVIQQPVEQETDWPFPADQAQWVVNPFTTDAAPPYGCPWDVDDEFAAYTQGKLSAGASVNFTACLVGSPDQFFRCVSGACGWWSQADSYYQSQVTSTTATLTVSLCYDGVYARCFTPPPVFDPVQARWVWSTCTREQYAADDPALVTIPGSQGGVGVVEHVTYTVANSASHGSATVFAQTGKSSGGCTATVVQEYPYSFTAA